MQDKIPFLNIEDVVAETDKSGAALENTRLANPVKRFLY